MADTWGDAPSTGDAWGTGGGGGGGGGGATGGGFGGSGGYNMDDLVKEQGAVDWSTVSLSHFSKDFYRPTPQTAGRSKGDIEQWRNIHKVTISGAAHKVTGPILTFKEADLPHYVMDQIRAEKFVEPTPIQAQAWPVILAGHDLVGIAKTGSGKTLAFGIPMVIHMRAQPALGAGDGPIALCMAPTRELATQIEQEFQKILRGAGMRSVCCYGGQGRRHQEGILRAGVHAVVATAGRLLDFLKNQATNLRRVTYLVIDEAHRMLDMGFEPQVRGILSQIRPDRQSLLFSATWPREVEALASDFLTDYVKINIGYEHLAANTDVRQHIWFVEGHDRLKELLSLIMQVQEFVSKMLVFCKTKTGCDECVAYLRSQRIKAFVIHGDKTQEERESTLQAFRDAESSILVATDVAQRGLDIRSLQAVVNLDFPVNKDQIWFSGYMKEKACYHHGEVSTRGTIAGMAQDSVGSNNPPFLAPCGMFGSRHVGGKDCASARYIHTKLAPSTRVVCNKSGDFLLNYKADDGTPQVFKEVCAKLWAHENQRCFYDRLVSPEDKRFFTEEVMMPVVTRLFPSAAKLSHEDMFEHRPIIWGDFLRPAVPIEERMYEECQDLAKLPRIFTEYLDDYNINTSKAMNLVFFNDHCYHPARITRILRQPRSNALLVGIGGSGKQSLTRRSASICQYQCFQIEVNSKYNLDEFHEDPLEPHNTAGIEQKSVVFLMNDAQIVDEGMVEDMNNMLNSGEVPSLFTPEEKDKKINQSMERARDAGMATTRDDVHAYFVSRVRDNVHIVLCMSPVGDAFRTRCRNFLSLTNCCAVDWFDPWPDDALLQVALRQFTEMTEFDFKQFEVKTDDPERGLVDIIIELCVEIHSSVTEMSEAFYDELRRRCYVTPTSYLDFISLHLTLLDEKHGEVCGQLNQLKGGSEKMKDTNTFIAVKQKEITAQQPLLEESAKKTAALLHDVSVRKEKAAKVRESVGAQEAEANEQYQVASALKADTEADLAEALPALEAAEKALQSLDKSAVNEIKSYANPPKAVEMTMQAVMIMLDEGKYEWKRAKDLLGRSNFLSLLLEYDRDHIPKHVINKVACFINDDEFTPVKIEKGGSAATKVLCIWCHATYKYYSISVQVAPQRAALEKAEADLEITNKMLKEAQTALMAVEDELAELERTYKKSTDAKAQLEENIATSKRQLANAEVLTDSLGSESESWARQIVDLGHAVKMVPGNVFLSSASIVYYGAFTPLFRKRIVSRWLSAAEEKKLPVAEGYSLVRTLADPMQIREWQIYSLPTDETSSENAVLCNTSCDGHKLRRWPLMIDPQGQATKWIKAEQTKNGLQIVKMTDPKYLGHPEQAIPGGRSILIDDIGETLDPGVAKLVTWRSRWTAVRVGEASHPGPAPPGRGRSRNAPSPRVARRAPPAWDYEDPIPAMIRARPPVVAAAEAALPTAPPSQPSLQPPQPPPPAGCSGMLQRAAGCRSTPPPSAGNRARSLGVRPRRADVSPRPRPQPQQQQGVRPGRSTSRRGCQWCWRGYSAPPPPTQAALDRCSRVLRDAGVRTLTEQRRAAAPYGGWGSCPHLPGPGLFEAAGGGHSGAQQGADGSRPRERAPNGAPTGRRAQQKNSPAPASAAGDAQQTGSLVELATSAAPPSRPAPPAQPERRPTQLPEEPSPLPPHLLLLSPALPAHGGSPSPSPAKCPDRPSAGGSPVVPPQLGGVLSSSRGPHQSQSPQREPRDSAVRECTSPGGALRDLAPAPVHALGGRAAAPAYLPAHPDPAAAPAPAPAHRPAAPCCISRLIRDLRAMCGEA